MEFKVGQIIVWVSNTSRTYLLGAKAIVTGKDHEFLIVKWLPPCKQMDGGYYPGHFELAVQEGEQLLFDFMSEGG